MKKFLLIYVCCLIFMSAYSQDPDFTQFYANPTYLNPAFAGTGRGPRIALNFRDLWPSVPHSWVTYAASWDQNIPALAGGLGAQVLYDQAGIGKMKREIATFMYAYQLNVSPKFAIRMALKAGVQQLSIDFTDLTFPDQIDSKAGFVFQTKEPIVQTNPGIYQMKPFPDFSAGILGYSDKFFGGFAVDHINQPKQSFLGSNAYLPMKYTAHAGLMIPLEDSRNPEKFFSPNVMFQNQLSSWQLNVGAYFIKERFVIGAWMRQTSANFDAAMALIGVTFGNVKFGYSYDITFSEARYGAKGSHEASLIFILPQRENLREPRWHDLRCPSF